MSNRKKTFLEIIVAVKKRLMKNEGLPFFRNYFILLFFVCIVTITVTCLISSKFSYFNEKNINEDKVSKNEAQGLNSDNSTTSDNDAQDVDGNKDNNLNLTDEGNKVDSDNEASDEFDDTQDEVVATETPTVDPNIKKVYLTFDDGPGKYTENLLDTLKKYDIKATFFVIGKTDEYSVKMYNRIVNEGHTLGVHSYTHDYKKIYASSKSFIEDFEKLKSYLEKTTGITIKYSRFPGGSSTSLIKKKELYDCIKYLNGQGIEYFDWNVINGDAEGKKLTQEQMINNVISGVKQKNTSVVLMHDANDKEVTVKSIPKLIDKLKKEDVEILPIDESTPVIQHVKASVVDGE